MIVLALFLAAVPGDDCRLLTKRAQPQAAIACFTKLAGSPDPWKRAEGLWGLKNYKDALAAFDAAMKVREQDPDLRVRCGRLFLERFNLDEATKLFEEALELKKDHAGALLGLATMASADYNPKAVDLAQAALKSEPDNVEALELLARAYVEDSNFKQGGETADRALQLDALALDAMAVKASIELLGDRPAEPWFAKITAANARYGRAHVIVGRLLVLNRRYEEAIAQYRQALKLEPDLHEARSEMGINLMRVGRDLEARQELQAAWEAVYRNAATTNSLNLLDTLAKFTVYPSDRLVLRMRKDEGELLKPYVEREALRALDAFEKKYQYKLKGPVSVELYPDHDDFAVRTMGLPGLGALGVTFGLSVAMDSPSGRKPGAFHWASTLWHELSHVYTVTATRNRIPRWFTEGIAVHEETAANEEWGDRLTPDIVSAMKEKKLLPIEQLDRGFIRPRYPNQVIVSYFQAGRVIDYISGRWGFDKVLTMIERFGKLEPVGTVLPAVLQIEPKDFDRDFLAWLHEQHKTALVNFEAWKKEMPEMNKLAAAKDWDRLLLSAAKVRDLYPEFVEPGCAYEWLAEAYSNKGDKAAMARELERYMKQGGRNPALLKKLAAYHEEQGRLAEAAAVLERVNVIFPVGDEGLHQRLGDLYAKEKRWKEAAVEYAAVVNYKPTDRAGAHYNLARTYKEMGRLDAAADQVFFSLEAAPNYRAAQKLMLEINAARSGKVN